MASFSSTATDGIIESHKREESIILKVINVSVGDNRAESEEVMLEQKVIFKQLLFMGRIELHHFSHLPLNAIFFASEEGMFVLDDTYLLLHRYIKRSASEALASTRLEEFEDEKEKEAEEASDGAETARLMQLLRDQVAIRLKSSSSSSSSSNNNSTIEESHSAQEQLGIWRKKVAMIEAAAEAVEMEAEADEAALRSYKGLNASMELVQKLSQAVTETEGRLKGLINKGIKTKFLLDTRQLVLIGELQTLYPIEKVRSGGAQYSNRYAIRGLEMPAMDCPQRDEEQLTTALGFLVHLLCLLSKYMEIPMRYQMLYFSSRSMVRDAVLGQSMPLYRKDIEAPRFRRAVQWLGRNVAQLMSARGLVLDKQAHLLCEVHRLFTDLLTGTPLRMAT
jgi:hypothetical protein